MTTINEYQSSITNQMCAGVNYLLRCEHLLTDDLSNKLKETIANHVDQPSVCTYGEISKATENICLTDEEVTALAHRLCKQLVSAVQPPVDALLVSELGCADVGSHDGLWYGMTWMDDDPSYKEVKRQIEAS